jgi:hypothetical protein
MQMIQMRWFLVYLFPLLFVAPNIYSTLQPSKVYGTQELSSTSMAPWRGQHAGGSDLKKNHDER